MYMPAICDKCKTVFASGMFFENCRMVSLSGNTSGPCPKCGSMGHIPDGVFSFMDNTIELLSGPDKTIKDLLEIEKVLKLIKTRNYEYEDIREEYGEKLSSIVDILPKNRTELYAFIGVILVMIQIFISLNGNSNDSSTHKNNITNIYNTEQVINYMYNDSK